MLDSAGLCACECDDVCECGPAEFVRLRYYYGQRLGAIDFNDAQAYSVGKQRFHNLRAHGAGVLCGLEASRFVFPQDAPDTTPTTILRVTRGAALDACGREVIVPVDHCIDVAAWFAKNRQRPELSGWTPEAPRDLWVALRYRECPSDPMPAPRDPCGCDAGGCEFGRIREGFELAVLAEKPECSGAVFPTVESLQGALQGLGPDGSDGPTAERLRRSLSVLLTGACPRASADAWICLAVLKVTLNAGDEVGDPPKVVDLSQPDNTINDRASLLNTAALQALLTGLLAASADEGFIGNGPRIGVASFAPGSDDTSGTLTFAVELVSEGDPPAPVALAEDTFRPEYVVVQQFVGGTWQEQPPDTVGFDATQGIVLTWESGSLQAGRYRVSIAAPPETPIVDSRMRPLRPALYARHLRLVSDSGTLQLAETLF